MVGICFLDELIAEINNDIEVASNKLDEPNMMKYKMDAFFKENGLAVKNDCL